MYTGIRRVNKEEFSIAKDYEEKREEYENEATYMKPQTIFDVNPLLTDEFVKIIESAIPKHTI